MEGFSKLCIPEITISQDKMSAKLKLHLDDKGQELNLQDLVDLLRAKNVKTGINEAAISEMLQHDLYDIFVEVAKGKVPVKGKDGYFIFHVENPEVQEGPKELEDGSVEYVQTAAYTIVEEGQLLAEYVPATNGEYGYTLDNEMRTPQRGKELSVLRGKGFRMEENRYYAIAHGKFEYKDNSIYITNLLEIKGDVDISFGHVSFDGDVNIRGDVKSGMMVRATGNVEIRGHVGNSYVEAGKNILLSNGMQGKFTGKLKAGGDITCKFCENTQMVAGGNIIIRSVLNSKLEAEGKVTVEGRDSVVLGGSVHAIQGMELNQAGNDSEISTVLAAGVLPQTIRRDAELTQLIDKVTAEVDLLDRSAKIMERMVKTKVTKEVNNRRMKIIQAKVIKSTELKKYQDEKLRIAARIRSGQDANVTIQNIIYPGCSVEIAGKRVEVRQQLKHVKFILKDGNVEASLLY